MPTDLILFGDFAPDASKFDTRGFLADADNMLPVFGSWRPLRRHQAVVALTSTVPPNSAYTHPWQSQIALQFGRPGSDSSDGDWIPIFPLEPGDLYAELDESEADDGDYIVSGPDPSTDTCEVMLAEMETPSSFTAHTLRWRYRIFDDGTAGTYTITVNLKDGATTLATDSVTAAMGSQPEGWTQEDHVLTAGELTAMSTADYTNLSVEIIATCPGSTEDLRPDGDSYNGDNWRTEAGGTTDIYQSIDEASPSDADYIISQGLQVGGMTSYQCSLGDPTNTPFRADPGVVSYRYRGHNAGMSLTAKLMRDGNHLLQEQEHTGISTSFATSTFTITDEDLITDWDELFIQFVADYPSTAASTVDDTIRPDADVITGGWTPTPLWDEIDNDSDASFISGEPGEECQVSFPAHGKPSAVNEIDIIIRARNDGASVTAVADQLRVQLYDGATLVDQYFLALTNAFAEYTNTVTAPDKYTDLRVSLGVPSTRTLDSDVSSVKLEFDALRSVEVSWAEFEVPSKARAEISWVELETPSSSSGSFYNPDAVTHYMGTENRLYRVDSSGFTDVSQGGTDYATGSFKPLPWSFVSWGDLLIATNFVDPVQSIAPADSAFADLITEPAANPPQGRHLCAVRGNVVLSDINDPAGSPDFFPNMVWWSDIDDATEWDYTLATGKGAGRQELNETPGGVVRSFGGDYGIHFKRTSITRQVWIGPPFWYGFEVLSRGIGADPGSSCVAIDEDIYFKSLGQRFWVLRQGSLLEEISSGVNKFYFDQEFSDDAIRTPSSTIDPQIAESFMSAAYDPGSGCIFWLYRDKGDSDYQNTRLAVYNIRGRWAPGTMSDSLAIIQSMPGAGDLRALTRHLYGYDWNGSNRIKWRRFLDQQTYTGVFRHMRLSLGDGKKASEIKGIRLVFVQEPSSAAVPKFSLRVDAWDDPAFENNKRSQTWDWNDVDTHGWFPVHVNSMFVDIQVTVPPLDAATLKEVVGVQIDWDPVG